MQYIFIFKVFPCNINTTILTQFLQYPNIDQITLMYLVVEFLFNCNYLSLTSSSSSETKSTIQSSETKSTSSSSQAQPSHSNKTSQSIVQKYSVECKGKFDELAKIILKLNLCRKELREYDKQFKSESSVSINASRKNSTVLEAQSLQSKLSLQQQKSITSSLISLQAQKAPQSRSTCFGCASASIENCITLFRALLCSNNVVQAPGK